MPCRSEHMEPNRRETESRIVCGNVEYLYVVGALHLDEALAQKVRKATQSIYGDVTLLDAMTRLLCQTLREMSPEAAGQFVYDGRNALARRLADWWDKHQEADRRREEQEAAEKRRKQEADAARSLAEGVLDRLTPEERAALRTVRNEL